MMRFRYRCVGLILGLVVMTAIAAVAGGSSESSEMDESVVFLVADPSGKALPGVEALLLTSKGEEIVGVTDALGAVEVSLETLSRSESQAILFCKEWFYCGAFRTSEERFLEYREHYIKLAQVALR